MVILTNIALRFQCSQCSFDAFDVDCLGPSNTEEEGEEDCLGCKKKVTAKREAVQSFSSPETPHFYLFSSTFFVLV